MYSDVTPDDFGAVAELMRENEHTRQSAQYPEEESTHLQRLSELSGTRDAVQQGLEAAKQQTRLVLLGSSHASSWVEMPLLRMTITLCYAG